MRRISRQLQWQRDHKAKGLCQLCSEPAYLGSVYCKAHYDSTRSKRLGKSVFEDWRPGHPGRPPITAKRICLAIIEGKLPLVAEVFREVLHA